MALVHLLSYTLQELDNGDDAKDRDDAENGDDAEDGDTAASPNEVDMHTSWPSILTTGMLH